MAFVKLDTGMLQSSIWPQKIQRDVFLTALLMAEPCEVREPTPQLKVREIKETGWKVPPGWYGMIHGASVGILHNAMVDREEGMDALEALGEPDPDSRSRAYDGRRLVRVNGGYIVLNYIEYRERDYGSAERSRRWRERQRLLIEKEEQEEERARQRANGQTIRPEHRDDHGKI